MIDERMDDRVRVMTDAEFLFEVAQYDRLRGWILPTEYRDRVRAIVRNLEQFAALRDVEIRIYPDGSVGVESMTTYQRDDDAVETVRALIPGAP